jgi:hypothetical protein
MATYLELSERRGPFTPGDVRLPRFPEEFICEALLQASLSKLYFCGQGYHLSLQDLATYMIYGRMLLAKYDGNYELRWML